VSQKSEALRLVVEARENLAMVSTLLRQPGKKAPGEWQAIARLADYVRVDIQRLSLIARELGDD